MRMGLRPKRSDNRPRIGAPMNCIIGYVACKMPMRSGVAPKRAAKSGSNGTMTTDLALEKLDFKRVLPILVIVLVDLMGLSIIVPLLPLFAARFGATPLLIGILQATYPMMQFIGAPILGRLS